MAWLTYWHVVVFLVMLTLVLVGLAYRADARAENDPNHLNFETGATPAGCLPVLLAGLCFAAAAGMALLKFVWWLV